MLVLTQYSYRSNQSGSHSRLESPATSTRISQSRSRSSAMSSTSSRGTEPPRGRSRQRACSVRRRSNAETIKRSIEESEDRTSPVVGQLPLSGEVEHSKSDEEARYEVKGAFRLKRKFEFRFPKPLSQPEPLWHPGDGFSSDEAKPNFIFSMTGTHKQKRPRPLPGVGKLQVEPENIAKEDDRGREPNRSRVQYLTQYSLKSSHSTAKEIWPTVHNFSEELVMRTRSPAALATEVIIRSTISPEPTPVPRLREEFGYIPPSSRKRKHSDFENFGRRVRDRVVTPFGNPESQSSYISQSENGHDEEDEGEEMKVEYAPEEIEVIPAMRYDESGNEEEESSQCEEVPAIASSQERSYEGSHQGRAEGSTTSGREDAKPEGTEWDPNRIPWAAGEVARHMLQFASQNFS
ncbi:hypothetical protein GGR53DRAFT_512887 [Hypoxylon sp. FL1150]|nr:hypothetical protein GGR53DRAFT_512887 [Hypoxylon sp. FL1150]